MSQKGFTVVYSLSKKLLRGPAFALLLAAAAPALAIEIPDTPDGTVRAVNSALADRHPEVLWQALPPTYQKDITELTHVVAGRMDPAVWDAAFGLGRKATAILRDKKALFLESSTLDAAGEDRRRIENGWDSVVSALDSFFASDVTRLETLKTIDWERYLATTGRQLMTRAADVSKAHGDNSFDREFAGKLQKTRVELVSRDGNQATVRMTAPGEEPEELALTRVEGRWVPSEMAADWNVKVAAAKEKLATITDEEVAQGSAQAMALIGMADAMLTELAAVESAAELDQKLQGLFGPLLGSLLGPGLDVELGAEGEDAAATDS